ncbi:MAG: hypothetical protein RL385_2767 [Pseudomonadota bacterium]|jgi:hypothetical protein
MSADNRQLVEDEALSMSVQTITKIRIGALDGVRDAWRFSPVPDGAYVLLRRDESSRLHAARTKGSKGLLYAVDALAKSEAHAENLLHLPSPSRFTLWWTLDADNYGRMLDDPADLALEGQTIVVQRFQHPTEVPLRSELKKLGLAGDALHTACSHILQRVPFYEDTDAPIFDVTPAPVRAVCTVELMQWFTRKAVEASANHLATLNHVSAMIDAAENGHKDLNLELQADKVCSSPEERLLFDYFRDYVWRCAATGVVRDLVATSLKCWKEYPLSGPPQSVPADDLDAGVPQESTLPWYKSAARIRQETVGKRHGPAQHPFFQSLEGPLRALVRGSLRIHPDQQEVLLAYFDNYRFGATVCDTGVEAADFPVPTHFRGRMATRMDDWSAQVDGVRTAAHRILNRDGPMDAFLLAHANCYPNDANLLERVADAACFAGYQWWKSLSTAEHSAAPPVDATGKYTAATWPYWETLRAKLKPLAEIADAAGRLSALMQVRLAAYDLATKEAEFFLDVVGRLEITLAGSPVDPRVHSLRTEATEATISTADEPGHVRIALRSARTPGAPSEIVLKFARTSASTPGKSIDDPPSGSPPTRTLTSATPKEGTYRVTVPAGQAYVKAVSSLSKPFGVLAETVNVAVATVALVDAQAKGADRYLACFELTKGVVGILENLPSAISALTPAMDSSTWFKASESRAAKLAPISKWIGRVDHLTKIYTGLNLLFSNESAVDKELLLGRPFRANVQRFSDWANLVVAASSTVEIAGVAAVGGLGAAPLLAAGFSSTPWGLLITAGGALIAAGSALVLDLTQPWPQQLMALERAIDDACKTEVRGQRLAVALRVESMVKSLSDA